VAIGDGRRSLRLSDGLRRIGYRDDERVDEAGEFAVRGNVFDVFPAGYYLPVRVEHDDGHVVAITSYDAASQRTTDQFEVLTLLPVSEAILPEPEPDFSARGGRGRSGSGVPPARPGAPASGTPAWAGDDLRLRAGCHLRVRATGGRPSRGFPRTGERRARDPDAAAGRRTPAARPCAALSREDERQSRLAAHAVIDLVPSDGSGEGVPSFAQASRPGQALATFVRREIEAGRGSWSRARTRQTLRDWREP
jgi:transcription-repair coupling factor (superfamily II helicase)